MSGRTVALAGNPNVGKSTVFNALTGLRQHTGNWPGKTVATAEGRFSLGGTEVALVDLPGTYSLFARSPEEEIAGDFLCFGGADAVIAVCDAGCLERNLYLVLQILEITRRVVVCVNLMDEAARRGIRVDLERLSRWLGVPVVGITARDKTTLPPLLDALESCVIGGAVGELLNVYPPQLESALKETAAYLEDRFPDSRLPGLWVARQWLRGDRDKRDRLCRWYGEDLSTDDKLNSLLDRARADLERHGLHTAQAVEDAAAEHMLTLSKRMADDTVELTCPDPHDRDLRADRLLTGRALGVPLMLALLAGIFWLTIQGANAPSQWLSAALFALGDRLSALLLRLGLARWLHDALILGAYRVLAWVVSVMLPPMAIFFPLFTLLEDMGYLPRVAFNLDRPFHRCRACGKQALTMAMGFGCNAVGVTGCRIIDSPRERLLAILTNSFVPCNGRFPILLTVIGMVFAGHSLMTAGLLTALVCLGVLVTFAVTKLLSATLLKGEASSFVLELPPYRKPQILPVLVRSLLDRTLFVLGRAAAVAAPAGLILWVLANLPASGGSLLQLLAGRLDPLGRLLGMDGVLLLAFLLGFPANETVIPIALMIYLAEGSLNAAVPAGEIRAVLLANGWTWTTAGSVLLFTLFHWPCSTTLLTIRKETLSWKWTALAALLPTVCGVFACLIFHGITVLCGF